jgi:hypothetical protein
VHSFSGFDELLASVLERTSGDRNQAHLRGGYEQNHDSAARAKELKLGRKAKHPKTGYEVLSELWVRKPRR